MEKNQPSNPPIPLKEAKQQAKYWRDYCKKLLNGKTGKNGEELPVIKAFFIPKDDLEAVMKLANDDVHPVHSVAGLRIYFRLENEDDDLSALKAMIVPVVNYTSTISRRVLKDWPELVNKNSAEPDNSLVYDFTKPCPTECDNESELTT